MSPQGFPVEFAAPANKAGGYFAVHVPDVGEVRFTPNANGRWVQRVPTRDAVAWLQKRYNRPGMVIFFEPTDICDDVERTRIEGVVNAMLGPALDAIAALLAAHPEIAPPAALSVPGLVAAAPRAPNAPVPFTPAPGAPPAAPADERDDHPDAPPARGVPHRGGRRPSTLKE